MALSVAYREIAPELPKAIRALKPDLHDSHLSVALVEFVKLRVSQMNGCAYCTDLHARKLHRAGELPRKIAAVATWRESPFFSRRERAALELAEALTALADGPPSDDVRTLVFEEFDEETVVDLVAVIININCWNRLWVIFGTPEIPPLRG